MVNKIEYLRQEINHIQRLLDATNRAAEENKNYEPLMMIFVNQAERLEDEQEVFKKQLKEELDKLPKPSKGKKKNEKVSKKRTRRK